MYETQIARGAALLDTVAPGWRDDIERTRLDLASGCNCILGQAFGTYINGLNRYAPDDLVYDERNDWSDDHGFSCYREQAKRTDPHGDECWEALTEEWDQYLFSAKVESALPVGEVVSVA